MVFILRNSSNGAYMHICTLELAFVEQRWPDEHCQCACSERQHGVTARPGPFTPLKDGKKTLSAYSHVSITVIISSWKGLNFSRMPPKLISASATLRSPQLIQCYLNSLERCIDRSHEDDHLYDHHWDEKIHPYGIPGVTGEESHQEAEVDTCWK